jgi:hypothetical protein
MPCGLGLRVLLKAFSPKVILGGEYENSLLSFLLLKRSAFLLQSICLSNTEVLHQQFMKTSVVRCFFFYYPIAA